MEGIAMKKIMILIKIISLLLIFSVAIAFSQETRVNPKDLKLKGGSEYFNSYIFQSNIRSGKSLGTLAEEHSTLGKNAISFGFAAKSEEARFFIMGGLYSETIAYLKSGKRELALKRLESIEKEFINLNVPNSLYNYITKMRQMMESQKYSTEVLGEFLSLFQPFYEEYAKSKSEDKLILFRAGSWLVDMSLTAAAGDNELLRQIETLDYFNREMKRMDAPKGVMDGLEEITKIAEKKEITDRDADRVLNLVKKIQTILG
jgi:hypothetical protein